MTKLLVATVVLQLVAEARLSLQDPLVRWLPGLLSYGDHVTIRQLLNHTGGVPDYAAIVSGTLDRFGQGRFGAWARRSWSPWWPTSHRASRQARAGPTPTPAMSCSA